LTNILLRAGVAVIAGHCADGRIDAATRKITTICCTHVPIITEDPRS
jgi:hypothetical protein